MRGKRSKQYRKLMQQYAITFGFREPYQVLVDAEIMQDAAKFKMDLVGGLERTLHGKVKPMITQCSIRHLYTAEPRNPELIDQAKEYERRRCDHHTLEKPLSTLECLRSVVDPKGSRTNKHRYVVASQTRGVRELMRTIPGVPLVYINRSVMIMEPMAGVTEQSRAREEKAKFRAGINGKRAPTSELKRKSGDATHPSRGSGEGEVAAKKSRRRGPKGPNPLSVKKPKKKETVQGQHDADVGDGQDAGRKDGENRDGAATTSGELKQLNDSLLGTPKKKRKRKHASKALHVDPESLEAEDKDAGEAITTN